MRKIAANRSSAKAGMRPALVMICFALFALGVLSLHQERIGRFTVDEEWPIPAALSHVLFASPLGLADKALLQYFLRPRDQGSTAEMVEQLVHGDVTPTHNEQMSLDGEGTGPALSATLAFELFGAHARSLSLLFLTLLGISAASYVLRFRDERLWIAPVFVAGLTFLLLTPGMELKQWATEAPIGGIRSYILLAILPTLHWCFELVAGKSASRREALFRGLLLGIQVAILGVAILVRYSPICLIPAVFVSAFLGLRYNSARRAANVFLVPLVGLIVVLYGILPLTFPDAANGGRLRTLLWHRAIVGLSIHPEWPFPGLRDQYPCPQLPGALRRQSDSNGACIWFAFPPNQSRSEADIWGDLYGPQYETAMREAFFRVAFRYPRKTLETFLYYKPLMMAEATQQSLIPWSVIPPRRVIVLALLQFVLLVGFLTTEPATGRGVKFGTGMTIALALVFSAFLPHLLAWTNPPTGQELAAGTVFAAIVGVWLGCRVVLRRLG